MSVALSHFYSSTTHFFGLLCTYKALYIELLGIQKLPNILPLPPFASTHKTKWIQPRLSNSSGPICTPLFTVDFLITSSCGTRCLVAASDLTKFPGSRLVLMSIS